MSQDSERAMPHIATGNDLKKLREELGFTQRAFAKAVGQAPGTIATWERRKCKALTGPANFFFHQVDNITREPRKALKASLDQLKIG